MVEGENYSLEVYSYLHIHAMAQEHHHHNYTQEQEGKINKDFQREGRLGSDILVP